MTERGQLNWWPPLDMADTPTEAQARATGLTLWKRRLSWIQRNEARMASAPNEPQTNFETGFAQGYTAENLPTLDLQRHTCLKDIVSSPASGYYKHFYRWVRNKPAAQWARGAGPSTTCPSIAQSCGDMAARGSFAREVGWEPLSKVANLLAYSVPVEQATEARDYVHKIRDKKPRPSSAQSSTAAEASSGQPAEANVGAPSAQPSGEPAVPTLLQRRVRERTWIFAQHRMQGPDNSPSDTFTTHARSRLQAK
eukprot:900316-Amphidinium_carterae.4